MFQRTQKEYKGTTIYMTKCDDIEVEKYLDRLVRNIENYVKQKGTMPEKIRLGYGNFNKILDHNKNLIEKREEKYYTFGVEIEV